MGRSGTGNLRSMTTIAAALSISALAAIWWNHPAADAPRLIAEPAPVPILVSYPQAERITLDGGVDWINSGPISLRQLRGKIVLLDFWTYCCINCHHILPDLAKLEKKYENELVVIGVHTPKFPAEHDTENIRKKVQEYRIRHPVINDARSILWRKFHVRSWPTLVLIDANGVVDGAIAGEGHFETLDKEIARLIENHKSRGELNLTPVKFDPEVERAPSGPLLYPGKIVADVPGNRLFVSDTGHNRIIMAGLDGKNPVAIGDGEEGLVDGGFTRARFNRPQGMCLNGDLLYVADTENHALRAVNLKDRTVSTIAGDGKQSPRSTIEPYSGPAAATQLSSPWDVVAIPSQKALYIAMAGPHQIWKLDLDTNEIGVYAGSGYENIEDGPAANAKFAQPSGITTDGSNLFIADSEDSGLRVVWTRRGAGPMVQTIIGHGLFVFGDHDGRGGAVRLQHCLGVSFSGKRLYVADTYNNKIKVCNTSEQAVKTLAGTGKPGLSDSPAHFYQPGGVSATADAVYVADTNNHAIRKIDLKTETVTTIKLDGLGPPRVAPRAPVFPNAQEITAEAVKIQPSKSLAIKVSVPLPSGFHVNEAVAMPVAVETPGASGILASDWPIEGRKLKPPSDTFAIEVPLAATPRPGESFKLKVSTSLFVCAEKSNLCMIKSVIWNVPVTVVESGGAAAITLERQTKK